MQTLDGDTLLFFNDHPGTLPLFAAVDKAILDRYPAAQRRVQKTQITYYHRHVFACVSFARVKRKADLPESWLTLTLGLPSPADSPRAAAQTQVRPGRWTVHFVIGSAAELDEELLDWLDRSYALSER